MSPGAVIAVAAWGLVVLMVLYGLSFDLRRWLERRRERRRPVRSAVRTPVWIAGNDEYPLLHLDEAMERTLHDIQRLPMVEPKRRLAL